MQWFYNLKIAVKLIIGFLIVAFIAGVIGVIGVINIRKLDALDTKLYRQMTAPLGEMVTFVEAYQRMRGNVKDIILSNSETEIADYESRIKERNEEFDTNLLSFKETLLTEEGKQLTQDLIEAKKQYDLLAQEIIKNVRLGNRDLAMRIMTQDMEPIRQTMEAAYRRMVEIKVNAAKETAEGNTKTANDVTTQTIVIVAVGMALSILFGIFISSSINKPLKKLVAVSMEIADGNLDVTIDINSKDEVGFLANSFEKMADKINEAMSQIYSASEQVAAGSRQVSDSSMALSQGATEQASSIEELTASLEEISSQTKLNAQNANEANELAENAKTNALLGNSQMNEMLKAMEEINESSSNISKIIKVIDEIAFQTNILALNAAVEAARAGQHGKGFAVVAEEVRNLAARSANAAKETTDLIEGSIKKVEGGTRIAKDTAEALDKIVGSIEKVADLVNAIAIASNEQATGIGQINQGIMQVSQVVQTNSATSEESAAASEELSGQAELLKEMVSKFKLRQNTRSHGRLDRLTPEVLKMLEDMSGDKKSSPAPKESNPQPASGKAKIVLSDREFGKY